jgi:hypothetical protein
MGNWEDAVATLGGRTGFADGNVEPWDNTDCDRTVEAGVSLNGKRM